MPSQPCSPSSAMKARRLGVSTIWAMFSRVRSKTSGSSLASRKVSTSLTKASCSGGELEVHVGASGVQWPCNWLPASVTGLSVRCGHHRAAGPTAPGPVAGRTGPRPGRRGPGLRPPQPAGRPRTMRGILSAAGYVPYRRLSGPTSLPSSAPAVGRAPGPWPPTTRTPPPWGWRRPAWPCAPVPGGGARRPVVRHRLPGLPGQDQRHRRPCRAPAPRHEVAAFDFGGGLRSGSGALLAALTATGPSCWSRRPARRPTRPAATSRPAATARPPWSWARRARRPGAGRVPGRASATDEFVDRWRTPGERRSKVWEERFGETRYIALGRDACARALKYGRAEGRGGRPDRGRPACTPGR